jgi:hypothetical protein
MIQSRRLASVSSPPVVTPIDGHLVKYPLKRSVLITSIRHTDRWSRSIENFVGTVCRGGGHLETFPDDERRLRRGRAPSGCALLAEFRRGEAIADVAYDRQPAETPVCRSVGWTSR